MPWFFSGEEDNIKFLGVREHYRKNISFLFVSFTGKYIIIIVDCYKCSTDYFSVGPISHFICLFVFTGEEQVHHVEGFEGVEREGEQPKAGVRWGG